VYILVTKKEDKVRVFFDDMSHRYDSDLQEVGWDPLALLEEWNFVAYPHMRVLDIGCGTGTVLAHFSGAGRKLIGFDISDEMIRKSGQRNGLKGAELYVHSASQPWPVADASCDRVIAVAVLEFIEYLEKAFDELKRVLAPHGRAIITVEDLADMNGKEHPRFETRYDLVPLWRRQAEDVLMALPLGLDVVRIERIKGYEVLEYGYTAAYWVLEIVKEAGV